MAQTTLLSADRSTIDRVKGLLILAVIVAHNDAVSLHAPWLRQVAYYFHVQGFFLLSSFLDNQQISLPFLRDRAVRYLVPHVIFVVLGWLGFSAMQANAAPSLLVGRLCRALALANDRSLYAATGMHFLWFLPCLFSFCLIKAAANRWRWFRVPMVIIALLWLPVAGLVPGESLAWVPYGLPSAVFFFGLGELAKAVVGGRGVGHLAAPWWCVALLAIALAAVIVSVPLGWVSAASVTTYDIRKPVTWVVGLVFPCVMLFALARSLDRFGGRMLEECGRYSMPLYLVHMFVYRGLTRAWFGAGFRDPAVVGASLPAGLAILVGTILGSVAFALIVWRVPLIRRILFPRSWVEVVTGR